MGRTAEREAASKTGAVKLKDLEPNRGEFVPKLRIPVQDIMTEVSVSLAIRFANHEWFARDGAWIGLSARLNRPRRRQETRETVAPAPRRFEFTAA